ncbi:hypothetical protein QQF64_030737 [Cirrhinus molitorella]|uniref:G-protein coupled receptors family 1 profile domain-containing protein n=1 Tax=Cirrhinus molitorella TaxID=172907 RepID=A0ABR3N4D9_9TELE
MNTTYSGNQTSLLVLTCTDSYPGNFIILSVTVFQILVLLPIHTWVLWLGTSDIRKGGNLATSDIFTANLSLLELMSILLFLSTLVAFALNFQHTLLLTMFFSGSYMVGRPFTNCLICVERYIAVAHPVIYRSPATVKHRYIGAGLVWLLTLSYGGFIILTFPDPPVAAYLVSLSVNLLVITACSLGVLKILLKPNPGETQKEGKYHQKKRAFVIITSILVSISVAYGMDMLIYSMKKYVNYDAFCVMMGSNMWLIQGIGLIQPFLYLSKLGKFSCIKG